MKEDFSKRLAGLNYDQRRLYQKLAQDEESESSNAVVCFYEGEKGLSRQELWSFLADRLPRYMIPDDFVHLPEIPRLPNGKIDISQLHYEGRTVNRHNDGESQGSELEEKIRQVWKRVLGLREVSLDENFFEIGGTSLLSIRIIQLCRDEGIRFTPAQFFKYQTIEQLSAGLTKAKYKAPTNIRQIEIIGIWEKVLDIELIGVHDDFFVIGGDEGKANQMLDAVKLRFGIEVRLDQLPSLTIEQLDRKLDQQELTKTSLRRIIPVRSKGNAIPLFCIQSEFYFETVYQELARYVTPDIPVLGVLSVSPELVKDRTPENIEEVAELCIQEIKAVHPDGPYYIAGFSIANSISYEVVRRLEQEGHEVKLFMIGPPMILSSEYSLVPSRANRIRYFLNLILRPIRLWNKLRGRLKVRNLGENHRRYIEGVFEQTGLLVKLIDSYRFKPIKSSVLFIDSDQTSSGYRVYRWDGLFKGNVQRFRVRGEHNLMIRPPMVERVAEIIQQEYKKTSNKLS